MSLPAILHSQRGLQAWVERALLTMPGMTPGAAGLWLMQDAVGAASVKDELGVYHGTPTNVTFGGDGPAVNGECVRAGVFGGTGYVDFAPLSCVSKSSAFSVMLVYKGAPGTIINHNNATNDVFGINNYSAGAILCGIYNGSSYFVKKSGGASATDWVQLIVTFDGAAMSMYINALPQSGALSPSLSTTTGFRIGSYTSGKNGFNGSIALCAVAPVAWTPEQVKFLYQSSLHGVA